MNEEGLPIAVILSAILHAGALFLFVILAKESARRATQTISNVDLLIPIHKTLSPQAPQPKSQRLALKSTFNFLKLALPSAPPKIEALKALSVPLPKERHLMAAAPKIEDRGRMRRTAKLESHLDMSRKNLPQAAGLEKTFENHPQSSMAQLPKLEEIGRRRAPKKILAAIALEDAHRQDAPMAGLDSTLPDNQRALPNPAEAPLEEAPREPLRATHKISPSLPPSSPNTKPQEAPGPHALSAKGIDFSAQHPSKNLTLKGGAKKGVNIEGPLANRDVISYNIPKFPKWALKEGIPEAAVSIRFWVSPDGRVLPGLRIEKTSGFGRLDRLAMEALKKWRFAAIKSEEKEWGVITFRFLLD